MTTISAAPAATVSSAQKYLDSLFDIDKDVENAMHRGELFAAFANLSGLFITTQCPKVLGPAIIDYAGVQAMMSRFQRDAYGLVRFKETAEDLVAEEGLNPNHASALLRKAKAMGSGSTLIPRAKPRLPLPFLFGCRFFARYICRESFSLTSLANNTTSFVPP